MAGAAFRLATGGFDFGVHRQHANAGSRLGFVIAIGARISIARTFRRLDFGAAVARVVMASSAYGWFCGPGYRATRRRAVSVGDGALHLRSGLPLTL